MSTFGFGLGGGAEGGADSPCLAWGGGRGGG